MITTLIMPCAGKSSRFSTTRPKWLLTAPSGNLMMMESLFSLDTSHVDRLIIVVAKQHVDDNNVNLDKISEKIEKKVRIKPEFLILDEFTSSQSETVYKAILQKDIDGSIFIKDCDNVFKTAVKPGNYVCVSRVDENTNAVNKGYILLNKLGNISAIIEKQIVSNTFSAGGYSFADAKKFTTTFESLSAIKLVSSTEIYISHIIQSMLLDQLEFTPEVVDDYCDFGTEKDWDRYTSQFKTIFIDLDGTLCQQSSEFFNPPWGHSDGIQANIEVLQSLYKKGKTTIIITTSRNSDTRQETIEQLNLLGIPYDNILFDLPHAKRILVNDFAGTNPYPTAVAINLERNSDQLKAMLK